MFYLYDTALVDDLRSLFQDSRISICPPDQVFKIWGELEDDTIEMPIISVLRSGTSLGNSQHSMRFTGGLLAIDPITKQNNKIQAIPIQINYLLDVWTKHREENDNIVRELIFWYMTHPTLKVKIPYGTGLEHNFNIFYDSNIEDNSDISDHPNRGEYFRTTLSVYTDDAYLWKSTINKPTYITGVDLYVKDGDKYVQD